MGEEWGDSPRTVYLKYEVEPNTDSKFDDVLIMESFPTFEAAWRLLRQGCGFLQRTL